MPGRASRDRTMEGHPFDQEWLEELAAFALAEESPCMRTFAVVFELVDARRRYDLRHMLGDDLRAWFGAAYVDEEE
eukprot:SAG25_NODE_305_length_10124_cov_16.774464_9_plen_76_part_00